VLRRGQLRDWPGGPAVGEGQRVRQEGAEPGEELLQGDGMKERRREEEEGGEEGPRRCLGL